MTGPSRPAGIRRKAADLASELARLATLDREACLTEWRRKFPAPASKHLSIQFLRKALAYEAQVAILGGLPRATARALNSIATGGRTAKTQHAPLKPGARLLREWNGRSHEVEVVNGGYRWKGKTYRSLTAIARAITGANWSGPRFFGVNR